MLDFDLASPAYERSPGTLNAMLPINRLFRSSDAGISAKLPIVILDVGQGEFPFEGLAA